MHGHDLLLDIDVQGALQVMKKVPEAVSIFILPPTPEVLERRLRNRSQAEGVADEAEIEKRLAQARNELQKLSDYTYALVNDVLDEAASEMRAIVLVARGHGYAAMRRRRRCASRRGARSGWRRRWRALEFVNQCLGEVCKSPGYASGCGCSR